MNQPNDRPNSMQDNRLADFTDRVVDGKIRQVESDVDEELIGLEKTILHLNQSFPLVSLDEATVKQMQVRLNARIRREEQETKLPFWSKWFAPQVRLQFGMISLITVLIIVLVISPSSLTPTGSSVNATAMTTTQGTIIVVLTGVILALLWIWIKRRK
jgi:hypothetical protein